MSASIFAEHSPRTGQSKAHGSVQEAFSWCVPSHTRPSYACNLIRQSVCVLGGVCGAQKLHELVTDLGRGFVLHPVAHIIEFEIPHQTGKAGAQFFHGWIELPQAIRLPRNVKGRLSDLRAFPSAGQIEIRLGGAVVVQATVKASAPEFGYVMSDVIGFSP